jgi:iron(III) transport system ATP-binding protein
MSETARPQLQLAQLDVGYGQGSAYQPVVQGLSLSLQRGQIGCLLGASGCGKTTVLRAISGFEPVRAGQIQVAGQMVASAAGGLPPEQRRVGLMFQDYALFPHLDVAGNVGFGLRGMARVARAERIAALLEQVGLGGQQARYPHELSGGQQQRVALARALAPSPEVLLLDEPFSNLDVDTRQRLAAELRQVLKAAGTTVLMVTHDQAEAFAMADRIGVMEAGRLLQWDPADVLYHHPASAYVAGFIGRGALVPAAVLGLGAGRVLLRPEHLHVDPQGALEAVLEATAFRGPGHAGVLRLADGSRVEVDLGATAPPAPGTPLRVRWNDTAPVRFD